MKWLQYPQLNYFIWNHVRLLFFRFGERSVLTISPHPPPPLPSPLPPYPIKKPAQVFPNHRALTLVQLNRLWWIQELQRISLVSTQLQVRKYLAFIDKYTHIFRILSGIKSSASAFNFSTTGASTGPYSTHPAPARERPSAGSGLPLHLQSKGGKIGKHLISFWLVSYLSSLYISILVTLESASSLIKSRDTSKFRETLHNNYPENSNLLWTKGTT